MIPFALLLQMTAPDSPAQIKLVPPGCKSDGDDIVVCGDRNARSPYRLPEIRNAERYEPRPLDLSMALGKAGRVRGRVSSEILPDGNKSDRVMIDLTLGF